jgi:fatty acid amide hydrolase 2
MDKLLLVSAIQLAKMIREKTVTSEEVVQTYITQARGMNLFLNAIVKDRYEQAIIEAKEVDKKLKADPAHVPALMGVPCTIKEMLAVKGMPSTGGLVYRKGGLSTEDATVVARLRSAGAIPLGITNVPVIGLTFETTNKLYGRTNNPYDLSRNSGGSSGGEAAMVSSAGAAFGLGTDGGGSIRIPANFCGIFGHKPSAHLVPNTGLFPDLRSEIASGMIVTGPLTRFSEDLMPIMKIISGSDGISPFMEEMTLGDETKVKIPELTYYFVNLPKMDPEVKKALDKALLMLQKTGAKILELNGAKFNHAFELATAYFGNLSSWEDTKKIIGGDKEIHGGREMLKGLLGRSDLPFHVNLLLFSSGLMRKFETKEQTDKLFKMGRDLKVEMNEILGPDGVLIFPTLLHPAIKHGGFLTHIFQAWTTAIFNIIQCPSTAIPMGLSEHGLPVGIQAVARKGNDHLTIAVARYMETQGSRWIPPKLAG